MQEPIEAVISAYLDGEPVDRLAVLEALDSEEGRRVLADFVRLRIVSATEGAPSPDFYRQIRDAAPGVVPSMRRPLAWTVGAALAASLLIGFFTGSSITSRRGAAVSSLSEEPSPPAARVIEFQPGVDWHQAVETGGRP